MGMSIQGIQILSLTMPSLCPIILYEKIPEISGCGSFKYHIIYTLSNVYNDSQKLKIYQCMGIKV